MPSPSIKESPKIVYNTIDMLSLRLLVALLCIVALVNANNSKENQSIISLRGSLINSEKSDAKVIKQLINSTTKKIKKEKLQDSATFNLSVSGEVYNQGNSIPMTIPISTAIANFFEAYLSSDTIQMNPISCSYLLNSDILFKIQCSFTDGDITTLQTMQSVLSRLSLTPGLFSSDGTFSTYSPAGSTIPSEIYPCNECGLVNLQVKKD